MSPKEMAKCLKWLGENASRPLTEEEKQLAHRAIDECRSVKELAKLALIIAKIR